MKALEAVDPQAHPGGFYLTYFLMTEKNWQISPNTGPDGTESIFEAVTILHGNYSGRRTVSQGEWFTSIDHKDAYFHVPIALEHRQFLCFAYRGRHWQF